MENYDLFMYSQQINYFLCGVEIKQEKLSPSTFLRGWTKLK